MKDLKFIRYGGLSPLKQDHYLPDGHPDKGFHNPPRRYGIYAMIKGYEDLFLLGATSDPNHISGKSQWLKDENGNLVEDKRDYDDTKKTNWGVVCPPELKKLLKKKGIKENQLNSKKLEKKPDCPKFDSDCDVCPNQKECDRIADLPMYLTVLKPPRIFEYKGELWHHLGATTEPHEILERSGSWVKTSYSTFLKAFAKDKHLTAKDAHKSEWYDVSEITNRGKDPYKGSFGMSYCKDHLEVFIEKI